MNWYKTAKLQYKIKKGAEITEKLDSKLINQIEEFKEPKLTPTEKRKSLYRFPDAEGLETRSLLPTDEELLYFTDAIAKDKGFVLSPEDRNFIIEKLKRQNGYSRKWYIEDIQREVELIAQHDKNTGQVPSIDYQTRDKMIGKRNNG